MASVALAACGGSGSNRFQPGRWLSTDSARRVATLTLRADGDGVSLGDFNGYARGQVLVEIPLGWRVNVRCMNASNSAAQSCAIVTNSLSTRPAFPGAATPRPTVGLDPGSAARFSFVASRAGGYRIASLVDDEEVRNGMCDAPEVARTRRPSVRLLRAIP
jgi:hypothetical protein